MSSRILVEDDEPEVVELVGLNLMATGLKLLAEGSGRVRSREQLFRSVGYRFSEG